MSECPECFCPAENHLVGIGCTTIVGYRVKIWILQINASFWRGALDEVPARVEDPIVCACKEGEARKHNERKKRNAKKEKDGADADTA